MIFVGSNGLRAGWRLAIFFLIFAVAGVALGIVVELLAHILHWQHDLRSLAEAAQEGRFSPSIVALSEATGLFAAFIATWTMSRIERRPLGAYGLPAMQAFRATFWEGALVGFAALTLVMLAIMAGGGLRLTGMHHAATRIALDASSWAVAFVLTGLAEEFIFRGYVQYTLTTGTRFWSASVLTSAAFALAHVNNKGETVLGIVQIVVFAAVLCVGLWRTGTLWFGVGVHAAWDWSQTFVYGVPDSGLVTSHTLLAAAVHGPAWLSGGSAGPEGSVFSIVALLLVAGYVWLRFAGGTARGAQVTSSQAATF